MGKHNRDHFKEPNTIMAANSFKGHLHKIGLKGILTGGCVIMGKKKTTTYRSMCSVKLQKTGIIWAPTRIYQPNEPRSYTDTEEATLVED